MASYMYIGPTVARLGLKRSTLVVGNTPPPQLQSIIDLNPMINSLFVPTAQVAAARQKLATKGTLEDLASRKVMDLAKEMFQETRKKS